MRPTVETWQLALSTLASSRIQFRTEECEDQISDWLKRLFGLAFTNISARGAYGRLAAHQAIYTWQAEANRPGRKRKRRPSGGQCRLRPGQLRRLERVLLKGAMAYGYATDHWTLERIGLVIFQTFGVRYSISGVWYILLLVWDSAPIHIRRAVREFAAPIHVGTGRLSQVRARTQLSKTCGPKSSKPGWHGAAGLGATAHAATGRHPARPFRPVASAGLPAGRSALVQFTDNTRPGKTFIRTKVRGHRPASAPAPARAEDSRAPLLIAAAPVQACLTRRRSHRAPFRLDEP